MISLIQNDEEETQPEYNETDEADGANAEESVEELIARAENMIRENARQMNILETSTISTDNDWMQQFISQPNASEGNNQTSSQQSTATSSAIHLADESGKSS